MLTSCLLENEPCRELHLSRSIQNTARCRHRIEWLRRIRSQVRHNAIVRVPNAAISHAVRRCGQPRCKVRRAVAYHADWHLAVCQVEGFGEEIQAGLLSHGEGARQSHVNVLEAWGLETVASELRGSSARTGVEQTEFCAGYAAVANHALWIAAHESRNRSIGLRRVGR